MTGLDRLRASPKIKQFMEDPLYRTQVLLYQGFFINLAYVLIKLASGFYYHSTWFISLAFYYLILTLIRYSLLRYVRRAPAKGDIPAELRRYRLVGILLIPMTLALAGMVILIVTQKEGYVYPGLLIYAMSAYTFYMITVAAVNVVKFRRHGSPVLSAIMVVNLTAALVSMLSLETAMIARFGEDAEHFRYITTGVSGAVVCAVVLAMASYMIIKATKRLDKEGSRI